MEIRIRETGAVVFENAFFEYAQTQGMVGDAPLTEELVNQYGGDIVLEGNRPSNTRYKYALRTGVDQIDGKWYTQYTLTPSFTDIPATDTTPAKTVAEQEAAHIAETDSGQAKSIRNIRNAKLSQCDWTQLADSAADKAAWATYRQELRDVPAQTGFPWEVTWPTQP